MVHLQETGFLAENAHFAEICESCKITFIGPDPQTIRSMGNKVVVLTITNIVVVVALLFGTVGLFARGENATFRHALHIRYNLQRV